MRIGRSQLSDSLLGWWVIEHLAVFLLGASTQKETFWALTELLSIQKIPESNVTISNFYFRHQKERDIYYKEREMKYYGEEFDPRIAKEEAVEVDYIPEPSITPVPERSQKLTTKSSSKRNKKDSKSYKDAFMQSQFIAWLLAAVLSMGLIVHNSFNPFKLSIQIIHKLRNDPRVQEVTVKRLKKEPKNQIKLVLKEGQKLSYKELDKMLLPLMCSEPENINEDIANKSAIAWLVSSAFLILYNDAYSKSFKVRAFSVISGVLFMASAGFYLNYCKELRKFTKWNS